MDGERLRVTGYIARIIRTCPLNDGELRGIGRTEG